MDIPPIQRNLFSQLPIPTQQEVNATCTPYYPYLWHSIMDPWQKFLQYRATDKNFCDFTEDEVAQWLTIQATHRIRHFFDGKQGIRLLTRHRKLVVLVKEKYAITVKKLTKRKKWRSLEEEIARSNNLTPSNQRYWNQQRGEDSLDVPRIILGYMLLKEITDIKILIAYPRTRRLGVQWVFRVPKQPALQSTVFAPRVVSGSDDSPEKGFTIESTNATEGRSEEKGTGSE